MNVLIAEARCLSKENLAVEKLKPSVRNAEKN